MIIMQYFAAQKTNLRIISNIEPFSIIFPLVDSLYVNAIELTPSDGPPIFGQILLVCHKSFLSAAALIGQAQPDDAGPITRRAIEAARFAAVVKTDPAKIEEWTAYEKRLKRWVDRQKGAKPKPLHVTLGDVHPNIKPTIEEMMAMHGMLSDADVHFTPEFMSRLSWDKREKSLHLNYFTKDQRELERAIILTSGTHLRILQVIDWCFDGAFWLNPDWSRQAEDFRRKAGPWSRKFEHPAKEVTDQIDCRASG